MSERSAEEEVVIDDELVEQCLADDRLQTEELDWDARMKQEVGIVVVAACSPESRLAEAALGTQKADHQRQPRHGHRGPPRLPGARNSQPLVQLDQRHQPDC